MTGTPSRQLGSMPMKTVPKRQMLSSRRGAPGRQEGKIPALGTLRKEQIIKKETRALETKQDPCTRAPSRSGVWSGHKRALLAELRLGSDLAQKQSEGGAESPQELDPCARDPSRS